MSNIFEEQYLKNFNNFIAQLKIIFSNEDTQKFLDSLENLSNEEKLANGMKFVNLFTDDENFEMFCKSKIKVFSHKSEDTKQISESLFGSNFCIKNILNNQPDDVKEIIWTNLHTMFFMAEINKKMEDQNNERLNRLNRMIYKKRDDMHDNNMADPTVDTANEPSDVHKKLHDMLGVDVNNETQAMIDDIIGAFEKMFNKSSNKQVNPMTSIMEVSKLISVKYADKINKGEIEIDKMIEAITKKIPGMEKMMGSFKDFKGMMGGIGGAKNAKEKVVIDENFSTASVELGKRKENKDTGMKLGNVLKMADSFGVLGGGKKSDETDASGNNGGNGGGLSSLFSQMDPSKVPNMEKMMSLFQKLNSGSTPEEVDDIKKELDTFMSSELGLDMSQFNEQIKQITNTLKESESANDEQTEQNKK
jgi:hypothetical protein